MRFVECWSALGGEDVVLRTFDLAPFGPEWGGGLGADPPAITRSLLERLTNSANSRVAPPRAGQRRATA